MARQPVATADINFRYSVLPNRKGQYFFPVKHLVDEKPTALVAITGPPISEAISVDAVRQTGKRADAK